MASGHSLRMDWLDYGVGIAIVMNTKPGEDLLTFENEQIILHTNNKRVSQRELIHTTIAIYILQSDTNIFGGGDSSIIYYLYHCWEKNKHPGRI